MALARQHNMTVFIKKYADHLLPALNNQPLFLAVIWSQACLESGYGGSDAAKNHNNFFGVEINNKIKTFSSPKDAFEYQANLFQNPNLPYISHGVLTATTAYAQVRAIADSGYYSMTNDETLATNWKGSGGVPKGWVWNGYTWTGSVWKGSHFTAKESSDHYYNNLKGFIDDALLLLPIGKVNDAGLASIQRSIFNLVAQKLP